MMPDFPHVFERLIVWASFFSHVAEKFTIKQAPDRIEPWIFAENICRGNFFQGILFSESACARFSTSFPYNFHRKLWSLKANRNTINEIIQGNCGSKNCHVFYSFLEENILKLNKRWKNIEKIFWSLSITEFYI